MPDLPVLLLLGALCGLIASAIMEAYQLAAARPFGQTGGGKHRPKRRPTGSTLR